MSTLYERIVAACNERGIKPGFMCDSIGIRRGTISELKNADYNYVSCSKIVAMAGFLKVSCDYLLTGKEFDGITEEEFNTRIANYQDTLTKQFEESHKLETEILSQLKQLQFNS